MTAADIAARKKCSVCNGKGRVTVPMVDEISNRGQPLDYRVYTLPNQPCPHCLGSGAEGDNAADIASMDEDRALAAHQADGLEALTDWDNLSDYQRGGYLHVARAIRTADERAGRVVVDAAKLKATEAVVQAARLMTSGADHDTFDPDLWAPLVDAIAALDAAVGGDE